MRAHLSARSPRREAIACFAAIVLSACWLGGLSTERTSAAAASRPEAGAAFQAAASVASGGDLYFVSSSGEYIERWPVAGGAAHQVAKAPGNGVAGMTIVGKRLFYLGLNGVSGSLDYVALGGPQQVHVLVGNLSFPVGIVAVDGWLYWVDQDAIGRVRPNGADLSRRFITLPQENGGGIANGLATDGSYLYFSRCQDAEIGRVDPAGQGLDPAFILLGKGNCPQGLAVGNDHVYWTDLGVGVGRATLSGADIDNNWLDVHTQAGPFFVVADNTDVYWDWGGVAQSPTHVGRAKVDGAGLDRTLLLGQGALFLTSPGANS